MAFRIFTRTWWRHNYDWPNALEPHAGRKTILHHCISEEQQARQICKDYNDTHNPGRLGRKAEYESI